MGGSPGQGFLLGSEPAHYSAGHKRLERGTFQLPKVDSSTGRVEIDQAQLAMILEGIDLRTAVRRKRYTRPRKPPDDS